MTLTIPEKLEALARRFRETEARAHKWSAASEVRVGLLLILSDVEEMQRERPYPSEFCRDKPLNEAGF